MRKRNILQITSNPGTDVFPNWSPDSSQIVFSSVRNSVTLNNLYVMNADGSKPTQLTTMNTSEENYATWGCP